MDEFVIWSFKHKQWWRANREGYTQHLAEAGRYNALDAGDIVTSSVMGESAALCVPVAERFGAPTVTSLWQKVEE